MAASLAMMLPVACAFGAENPGDWGEARWVWPHALGCPTNTVVELRQSFVSPKAGSARMRLAADTVYAIRLNGGEMKTGRFPDVPPLRFYDTLALDGLKAGMNELVISLYVQGVGSFQHVAGDPGLVYRLCGADGQPLSASGPSLSWRVSRKHQAADVPRITSQLGFSFVYDAALAEGEWRTLTADDCRRTPNDFELRPRPVPPVELLPPVTERVIAQGALDGSSAPPTTKLAVGMDATKMCAVSAADFFVADGKGVKADFFADGFYLLVDLGREEAGLLQLDADTDAGVVIDIGHAEHMQGGRLQTAIGSRSFAGRYLAVAGKNSFCRWDKRMAGRFVQLHVRGVKTHFKLERLTVRPTVFPVTERPMPSGLDPLRQQIWKTSVRTLRLCMHEHYEDCPWREQALYGNDSRNQMLAGYFAFDESNRMPELSLELLGRGIDEKGWIELCMPAKIGLAIPSFTFSWVLALGDHLKYRHDLAFTKSMMPYLHRVMDRRVSELVDGLLPCPTGKRYWQFYDWERDLSGKLGKTSRGESDAASNQYESPLNLFAVLAFESAAKCAEAVGETETAVRWRQAADRMRVAVREKFWNAGKRQFETRLGEDLAPAELSQALGLLAGAVPAADREGVVRKLSAPSDWTKTSLSQSLYKYEALRLAGGEAKAAMMKAMDETWESMLRQGATSFWEVIEGWKAFGDAGSLCHGWSAIPIYFYSVAN